MLSEECSKLPTIEDPQIAGERQLHHLHVQQRRVAAQPGHEGGQEHHLAGIGHQDAKAAAGGEQVERGGTLQPVADQPQPLAERLGGGDGTRLP